MWRTGSVRGRVLALSIAALALAACARGSTPAGSTNGPAPVDGSEATSPSDAGSSVDSAVGPDIRVGLELVADGLDQPLAVLLDPRDDALLVVQQGGQLVTLDGEVRLDLGSRVTSGGEQGFLDAEVHPDGDRVFVHYSGRNGETILAEYPLGEDLRLDDGAGTVLFTTNQPAANHNGGSVEFGPDGLLYLALGDGGRANDAFDQAQDTATPLGGILRFDVSSPGAAEPAGSGLDEPRLWAYGLRNPWRIAFDTGRLFVADVGQDEVEEVSVIELADYEQAAPNFGWPILEGDNCFAQKPCDDPSLVASIVNVRHFTGSCSITGGVVYRGDAIAGLAGGYLYSDVCDGYLMVAFTDGTELVGAADLTQQVGELSSVVGFGVDQNGEVLIMSLNGTINRLVPA